MLKKAASILWSHCMSKYMTTCLFLFYRYWVCRFYSERYVYETWHIIIKAARHMWHSFSSRLPIDLPSNIYQAKYFRLNSWNSLRHWAHFYPNFTVVKNSETWPRFSTPVALKRSGFRTERTERYSSAAKGTYFIQRTYWKSKISTWSAYG